MPLSLQNADGILHAASRTDMPGCAGRMFDWWFSFAPDTRLDQDRRPSEPARVSDQAGLGLVKHSNGEFTYLSCFLPSHYAEEVQDKRDPGPIVVTVADPQSNQEDSPMTATTSLLSAPELEDAARLLDPAPVAIETGVARLASGQLHVAARTDMPGCKGRMFEWWFRFAPDTQQYAWWHPKDHVSSDWKETSPQTHIGSTHIVQERLGEDPTVHDLQIHFVDPREIFGASAFDDALERGDVSCTVAAQLGMGTEPMHDERGRPNMGRMTHICRDTLDGMVLRSRFWLGAGTGLPPQQLAEMIPDALGLNLMVHAHTEFKYLARFLPSLYIAENREHESPNPAW